MKNKLILTLSFVCLSAVSVFAQGDWSVGDQSYSPAILPQAQGIPSSEKLTVQGTYSWMSFKNYDQNAHGMQLVYELPSCVDITTGTPELLHMDNSPVVGATFTPTSTGFIAQLAPGTTFTAATKLIFRISNLEIKDDQAYTNQQLTHSASFQTPTAEEQTANNSASISFSTFVVATPLPIQLLDFDARLIIENNTHKVNLDWSTISEENSAYFMVQKSVDATNWEDVAKIKAAGNSTINLDYNTVDNDPFMGISYYRLKLVDIDGQFNYSKVRTIIWNLDGAGNVRLHPNPTTDFINVTIDLQKKSLIEVKLRAIDGRVVQSATAWVDKGGDNLKMDLSKLANGIYNITVYKNDQEYFTSKVHKK